MHERGRMANSTAACYAVLATVLASALIHPGAALATGAFDPGAGEILPAGPWARTELLEDPDPNLVQERFVDAVAHADPAIIEGFRGDATPPSSRFLLHFAEGWDRATKPVPVLLVHGAGMNASSNFGPGPFGKASEGLAARLAKGGRAVFAVSFAHRQGDNVLQAEAVADAIARVRRLTGADKVDLVAHSKGGMACRIYLEGAGPAWTTKYRGDVRRYLMLGTPNGGLDVGFAYPNLNYWIIQHDAPAPLTWTRCLAYGFWIDVRERSIFKGGAYPGQAQMVARWDGRFGEASSLGQFDPATTYEGGDGLVSEAPGIDQAIADGGRMIEELRALPMPASLELAALAGNKPRIGNMPGEQRGPSDGIVFVESVLDLDPMSLAGAKVLRRDELPLNHIELVTDPRGLDWVEEVLELP